MPSIDITHELRKAGLPVEPYEDAACQVILGHAEALVIEVDTGLPEEWYSATAYAWDRTGGVSAEAEIVRLKSAPQFVKDVKSWYDQYQLNEETRARASEVAVERIPPGTYDPAACETCGRKDGLHDEEECFK
jgi:hypothetical protein